MEREHLIDKIRKLQALSQSPNLAEAEAAAAMVQRLVEQHRIAVAEIETGEDDQEAPIERTVLYCENGANVSNWRATLSNVVAKMNNCATYITRPGRKYAQGEKPKVTIVGTPNDVALVSEIFSHLSATVDRLALNYVAGNGGGKQAGNSFRWGAVQELAARMRAAKQEVRVGVASTALARVDHDAERVKEVLANLSLKKRYASTNKVNYSAYQAGCAAGSKIGLSPTQQIGDKRRPVLA
jgi:hypothetical protein